MSIKLVSTGGGSVTIQEPNTASDFTLSVPSRTATVVTDDGSGKIRKADLPSGSVIQVVSVTKTDVFSASMARRVYTDITGLSVSITPTSTSNKILVLCTINYGTDGSGSPAMTFRIVRNGTAISVGDGSGDRMQGAVVSMSFSAPDANRGINGNLNFLDSPSSTSSQTYKAQLLVAEPNTGNYTCYVNTSGGDANMPYVTRAVSTITVMEIAA
jgi:hypothetical protein